VVRPGLPGLLQEDLLPYLRQLLIYLECFGPTANDQLKLDYFFPFVSRPAALAQLCVGADGENAQDNESSKLFFFSFFFGLSLSFPPPSPLFLFCFFWWLISELRELVFRGFRCHLSVLVRSVPDSVFPMETRGPLARGRAAS